MMVWISLKTHNQPHFSNLTIVGTDTTSFFLNFWIKLSDESGEYVMINVGWFCVFKNWNTFSEKLYGRILMKTEKQVLLQQEQDE